jgi:Tfp pilus assembly protein PilF
MCVWYQSFVDPTEQAPYVQLFKNDSVAAQERFDRALEKYPDNPVADINAAFADLQLNKYQQAVDRMRRMTRDRPPRNKVLLASAYMTWAAAELKDLQGDHAAAQRYTREAMLNTTVFGNYGEVATLYFHLSWHDDGPVILNKFSNPSVVSFH